MATILYLGTDEGVVTVKSQDGRSWKIENHGLKDWSVPEVAVSPAAPNKVFAATRGDGVWPSEDFGATWSKPCYGKRGPGKVRCLSLDPIDPGTLYAGTEPIDVFKSRGGGKNWKRPDNELARANRSFVQSFAFDPANPDRMFAAQRCGDLFRSDDAGDHWFKLNVTAPALSDMKAACA